MLCLYILALILARPSRGGPAPRGYLDPGTLPRAYIIAQHFTGGQRPCSNIHEPGSRLIRPAKVSSLSKRPVRKGESGSTGL